MNLDRLLNDDESVFVCFYICAHYNALRLSSNLIGWFPDDYDAYLVRLRSLLHDLQIEDHYTIISDLAWSYAKVVGKRVRVDLSCHEPKTVALGRIEEDGKVVHLVTGRKLEFSFDGLAKRMVNIPQKHRGTFEWTSARRIKATHRTLICRVLSDANDTTLNCKSVARGGSTNVQGLVPVVLHQIDLFNVDNFDQRVDLSSQVHLHNGQYIKLHNQILIRTQLKIDTPLLLAPQFWVIKIPAMLLKRSTVACCDQHRKSTVGPTVACVRSNSIESHWKQVLGPIFISSANEWFKVPKLAQPVMVSLSRLSFLLPPGKIQKELSEIFVSYIDQTMPRVDLSEKRRNDFCLDEPQMVELVVRNLLAYDSYLDVQTKTFILEWICTRMKMVNVSSVYFTSSMLQYLHFLAHGIDRARPTNQQMDLLCKVTKLAQWIGKMLDEDQKDLKQLVEDEPEKEDLTDEEEEQDEEDTQEMSDSDVESHSEVSEQDQTEVEAQDEAISVANEPNQSVPPFSPTAHLRTMARKLNRKCAQLMEDLNDKDDH